MSTRRPVLQESQIFIKDFLKEADSAKKRIWIETMFFEPGPIIEQLEQVIVRAVKRNVDVRFTVDWVMQSYYGNHLRLFPSLQPNWKRWKHIQTERVRFLKRLSKIGVVISIVHKPGIVYRLLPMSGRNHNKIYIIDDKAWMGGINFAAELNSRDLMIKFFFPEVVKILETCFLSADRVNDDFRLVCRRGYTFYSDAGKANTSIILQETVRCILMAKRRITFVSQFVPDMQILRALIKRAGEGITVTIITGKRSESIFTKFPNNIFYLLVKNNIKNKENIGVLHYNGQIHAKLLLIDDSTSLIGSHNFIWSTVLLGTAEIAMEIKDKKIIHDSKVFIRSLTESAERMER